MKKINWFWFFIFIVMMTMVGFFVFDNTASSIIFGIAVGGIFGWIFGAQKPEKK